MFSRIYYVYIFILWKNAGVVASKTVGKKPLSNCFSPHEENWSFFLEFPLSLLEAEIIDTFHHPGSGDPPYFSNEKRKLGEWGWIVGNCGKQCCKWKMFGNIALPFCQHLETKIDRNLNQYTGHETNLLVYGKKWTIMLIKYTKV